MTSLRGGTTKQSPNRVIRLQFLSLLKFTPMKTIIALIATFILHFSLFTFHSFAQVQCIRCYHQNARVLTDTNNLIVNGGFENGCGVDSFFCPNSTVHGHDTCNITNWSCTGGGVQTNAVICDSNASKIVEGTKAAFFGNG